MIIYPHDKIGKGDSIVPLTELVTQVRKGGHAQRFILFHREISLD